MSSVCEFCDLPESVCVTKKEDGWSDCRGYICAAPEEESEEESEKETEPESECKNCGSNDVIIHASGPILCENCSTNEKGEPVCPKDQPFNRDELCNFCCDTWQKLEQETKVKAMAALREICKANPSLIEVTKKSE